MLLVLSLNLGNKYEMFRRFLLPVIDFVLPPTCAACGEILLGGNLAAGLCPPCFSDLTFHEGPQCRQCAAKVGLLIANNDLRCGSCLRNPPDFSQTYAGLIYAGVARQLILGLKHGRRRPHAHLLALPLKEKLSVLPRGSILIPIPLHPMRLRQRGFNQALDLAHALNKERHFEVWIEELIRIKPSPNHRQRSARTRREHARGAFAVKHPRRIKGRTCVLVDDVVTSGATTRAAAKSLKRAGAADIFVFAAARALTNTSGHRTRH